VWTAAAAVSAQQHSPHNPPAASGGRCNLQLLPWLCVFEHMSYIQQVNFKHLILIQSLCGLHLAKVQLLFQEGKAAGVVARPERLWHWQGIKVLQ
jgi:hypothetical protein